MEAKADVAQVADTVGSVENALEAVDVRTTAVARSVISWENASTNGIVRCTFTPVIGRKVMIRTLTSAPSELLSGDKAMSRTVCRRSPSVSIRVIGFH